MPGAFVPTRQGLETGGVFLLMLQSSHWETCLRLFEVVGYSSFDIKFGLEPSLVLKIQVPLSYLVRGKIHTSVHMLGDVMYLKGHRAVWRLFSQ